MILASLMELLGGAAIGALLLGLSVLIAVLRGPGS